MQNEQIFKNSGLNVSVLSARLAINGSYISRFIRYEGYDKFSSYVNSYRIRYVKQLL